MLRDKKYVTKEADTAVERVWSQTLAHTVPAKCTRWWW